MTPNRSSSVVVRLICPAKRLSNVGRGGIQDAVSNQLINQVGEESGIRTGIIEKADRGRKDGVKHERPYQTCWRDLWSMIRWREKIQETAQWRGKPCDEMPVMK